MREKEEALLERSKQRKVEVESEKEQSSCFRLRFEAACIFSVSTSSSCSSSSSSSLSFFSPTNPLRNRNGAIHRRCSRSHRLQDGKEEASSPQKRQGRQGPLLLVGKGLGNRGEKRLFFFLFSFFCLLAPPSGPRRPRARGRLRGGGPDPCSPGVGG